MILITSMGGCASTSFIAWTKNRVDCNCPLNSEGIRSAGPGSNPRGLKHRQSPPLQSDKSLFRENSFNRTDLKEGPIKRAIFLYDSPYNMVLSLFRRKIAMGHAIAVTGKRPTHNNNLDDFLEMGVDSFGFTDQFDAWTNKNTNCEYSRLLIKFDYLWENLDFLLGYMEIPNSEKSKFIRKHQRVNRMNDLTFDQKLKLKSIYSNLEKEMGAKPGMELI